MGSSKNNGYFNKRVFWFNLNLQISQSISKSIKKSNGFSFNLQRVILFNHLGEDFSCFQQKTALFTSRALNSTSVIKVIKQF
jgi:hypothetical protein